jgi:hypothetical protein
MTQKQYSEKLQKQIEELERSNKPLEVAVRSMMAVQSKRIFIDGRNASGDYIGVYKKEPVYISPNSNKGLPKFPLKGKGGSTKFKNGNTHKTGYFESFLDFKKKVGRSKKIQTVDLFLTGALQKNWANAETLSQAKAQKINPSHYRVAITDQNYKKAERYGNVFGLSKEEKSKFYQVIQFELKKALS